MAPFGVGMGKRARHAAPVSVGNIDDSGVGYVRNWHGRVRGAGPDTGRCAAGRRARHWRPDVDQSRLRVCRGVSRLGLVSLVEGVAALVASEVRHRLWGAAVLSGRCRPWPG